MSMPPHDDPREVVLQAEAAVSEVIFSTTGGDRTTQTESPADALFAAAAVAREGRRAAVILGSDELLGALGALHSVARGRAPITVHVVHQRPAPGPDAAAFSGRDDIPPALDVGAGVLVTWSAQDTVDA